MLQAYLNMALWSTTGDSGKPLRKEDHKFALGTITIMAEELNDFVALVDREGIDWESVLTPEQFAHDFWLTRNYHGAGFWDRGLGKLGLRLTELAQAYGGCELYVGADGLIHIA